MKMTAKYLERTGYRLPTEAEWEYTCRAGAETGYSFGESDDLLGKYAWYSGNSPNRSQPAGSLRPNDLGLFDMHGNAWEWCQDASKPYGKGVDGKAIQDIEDIRDINSKESRVLRGGSFLYLASVVRSANRNNPVPTNRSNDFGFRPARTLPLGSFTPLPATPKGVGADFRVILYIISVYLLCRLLMKTAQELIITKAYDLILWSCNHTAKFPRMPGKRTLIGCVAVSSIQSASRGRRPSSRVLRGGSFNNQASNVRSANRNNNVPTNRNNNNGFRPASTLPCRNSQADSCGACQGAKSRWSSCVGPSLDGSAK